MAKTRILKNINGEGFQNTFFAFIFIHALFNQNLWLFIIKRGGLYKKLMH